jgi:hypothetical protein
MTEPDVSDLVPTELTSDQPSLSPEAVALQAEKLGNTDQLRQAISDELDREVTRSRDAGHVQYEQAVLWRRINLWIGLVVGALAAATGTTGLVAKNSVAAAALAACATFAAGALTTLNASQRKVQASAAGAAYRELESEARRLRYVELPYVSLADALTKVRAITARRMSLQKVAEPPSAAAFSRSQQTRTPCLREDPDVRREARVVFWVPNEVPTSTAAATSAAPGDNVSDTSSAHPGPAEATPGAPQ